MYGPPGTGKTLLARACAAQTKVRLFDDFKTACDMWYDGFYLNVLKFIKFSLKHSFFFSRHF